MSDAPCTYVHSLVHLHMMRSNFPESHSNIPLQVQESDKWGTVELTEEELLITSPTLYAFSLADKLWCECIVFGHIISILSN